MYSKDMGANPNPPKRRRRRSAAILAAIHGIAPRERARTSRQHARTARQHSRTARKHSRAARDRIRADCATPDRRREHSPPRQHRWRPPGRTRRSRRAPHPARTRQEAIKNTPHAAAPGQRGCLNPAKLSANTSAIPFSIAPRSRPIFFNHKSSANPKIFLSPTPSIT